ncbi:MAG TPA: nitroreductase [Burkholderiales bacterium]|nr:nitroreductase [Burkholderiales bacterium]
MEFDEVVRGRYSCRRFLPTRVPKQTIESILALAQHTPSWCNCQPWQVLLVGGGEVERLRQRLYAHAKAGNPPRPDFAFPLRYQGIYRDRRKVCGVQLYRSLGIGREDKAAAEQTLENFRFFGAPHVALVTTAEDLGVYGAVDCGLYVGTFLLAARERGVDAIAQAALASYPDLLRDHFGLPAERKFVCGISFGYADAHHPIHGYRTQRADLKDVVDWRE